MGLSKDCSGDAACGCDECKAHARLLRDSSRTMADQRVMPPLRFYTDEQLGETQSITPEGFLLCENVPIARTGTMLYADGEIPVESGDDKIIRIHRDDNEVFHPRAVASFAGKPFTNGHPPGAVTPDNYHQYAVGTVMHPRRGDGAKLDNSFLYADILVTDPRTIREIRNRQKRHVSAGYNSEYEQLKPGEGRQFDIVGNHVALVDKGRCGPSCAIGDEDMAGLNWKDSLRAAVRNRDEAALLSTMEKIEGMLGHSALDEAPPSGTHIHLHTGAGESSVRDEPEAAAPAAADPKGGDVQAAIEAALQPLLQRLEAVEEAVVILADQNGDEPDDEPDEPEPEDEDNGEEEEPEEEPIGDRRTRDARRHGRSRDARRTRDTRRTRDRRGRGRDEGMEQEREDRREEERAEATGDQNPAISENTIPRPPAEAGNVPTGDRRRGTRDAAMTTDSSGLRVEHTETVSRGEMLLPGSGKTAPAFDSKKPANFTTDSLAKFRRTVLESAWKDPQAHDMLQAFMPNHTGDFRTMTNDAVTMAFNGASEIARQRNNNATVLPTRLPYADGQRPSGFRSPAEINEANRKAYGG